MIIRVLTLFWREILIGLLIATTAGALRLYGAEHDKRVRVESLFQQKAREAEDERVKVTTRGKRALEVVKNEHKVNVEIVARNAVDNYRRRYGDGGGAAGVRSDCNVVSSSEPAGSAGALDDAGKERLATGQAGANQEFIRACATDAGTVMEFQRFVRLNKLPVEGEE